MNNSITLNVCNRVLKNNRDVWFLIFGAALLVIFFTPEAHANQLLQVGTRIREKIKNVTDVIEIISGGLFIVGIMWYAISLLSGNRDNKYPLVLVIAGSVIFSAATIAAWAFK